MENLALVWLIISVVLVVFCFCAFCCSSTGSKSGGLKRTIKGHRKMKKGSVSDNEYLEFGENNAEMECEYDNGSGEYGKGEGDGGGSDYGGGDGGCGGGGDGGGGDSGGGEGD